MKFPLLHVCLLFSFASASSVMCNFGLQTEATLGWREDSANWCIPGLTEEDPGITSEVAWKDLRMVQVGARGKICGFAGLYARASGDYAWIYHGVNHDTDFWSRETFDEIYRSINDAGKGETFDVSGGVGVPLIRMCGLMISPIAGYAYMQQHLHMFDGKQVICVAHPEFEGKDLEGVDNTYHNRWKGAWSGIDVMVSLGNLTIEGEWEYHWTHFFGKGDWNLREDLAKGFYEQANGFGNRYNIRLLYSFCSSLSFGLGVDYWEFQATNGKSEVAIPVHVIDENGEVIRTYPQWIEFGFKEVNWRSFRVNGVLSISF